MEAGVSHLHSKRDGLVPYQQTEGLADLYGGPKTVWLPDKGDHAAIWDVDHADYEQRLTVFLDGVR